MWTGVTRTSCYIGNYSIQCVKTRKMDQARLMIRNVQFFILKALVIIYYYLLILFGVVLFPLVEPSSFHELRAIVSLVDFLLDSDLLSMWAVPRRTIFWSSVSWDLGKCRFQYPSWQAWEHQWRLGQSLILVSMFS